MLDCFAVQVGHYPTYPLTDIRSAGFNGVKFVLMSDHPDWTIPAYVSAAQAGGLKTWGIVARESLTTDDAVMSGPEAADYYAPRCAGLDYLTVLNEADGNPEINHESWCMTTLDARDMLRAFSRAFLGSTTKLAAVGTVAGDGSWVNRMLKLAPPALEGYTYLDNHAYAQWPDTVASMLANYDAAMLPKVVGEYGWDHPDADTRGQYIRDMARKFEEIGVVAAGVYCWHKEQGGSFYVWDEKGPTNAVRYIQELGYTTTSQPVQPVVVAGDGEIGQGFRTWQAREPALLGAFDEPREFGAAPGISQIRTTRGLLTWADLRNWTPLLTFYDFGHKTRHVWQESWPASKVV